MVFIVYFLLFLSLLVYFRLSVWNSREMGISLAHFSYITFYFLLAPILHIYYNYYPSDFYFFNMKESFSYLGLINAIGILIAGLGYLFARNLRVGLKEENYLCSSKVFQRFLFLYLLASGLYFLYLVNSTSFFYMDNKRDELTDANLINYMVVESFPIVFSWLICLRNKNKSQTSFYFLFLCVLLVSVLFGGMRGSRVSVIVNLIVFVLLYSSMIRAIKIKELLLLFFIGIAFNSIYSNYKYGGVNGLIDYFSYGDKSDYIENKDNEALHFLLGDMARSSVQAKIIDNINNGVFKPNYIPDTYVSSLFLLLPKRFRTTEFESKRLVGTRAQYGFSADYSYSSTRIYGLLGESLLNFGYYGFAIAFFLFGAIQALMMSVISSVKRSHYILFLPMFFLIPIYLLFYDLDNIVFQLIKTWLFPLILFFFSMLFVRISPRILE